MVFWMICVVLAVIVASVVTAPLWRGVAGSGVDPKRLDDCELLTYYEAQLGKFPAAVAAQARVLALKGADATVDDRQMMVDLMVSAADGNPHSYYVAATRAQIENAAFRAGVAYTLPDVRGPNAEDIANTTDLSDDERQAMVSQLAGRLADKGGPTSNWARLNGAYGVLGDEAKASEFWLEAAEVFAGSTGAMGTLRAAADAVGVVQ